MLSAHLNKCAGDGQHCWLTMPGRKKLRVVAPAFWCEFVPAQFTMESPLSWLTGSAHSRLPHEWPVKSSTQEVSHASAQVKRSEQPTEVAQEPAASPASTRGRGWLYAMIVLLAGCAGAAEDAPNDEPAAEPPAVESTWCCASHTDRGVRIDTFCGPNEEWSVNWANRNQNVRCWEVP